MNPDMEDLRPSQPIMTIFYAGKVNVYPNVSADKANAIMLLLSNDDASRSTPPLKGGSPCTSTIGAHRISACLPPHPHPSTVSPNKGPVKRSQAELPFARKFSLSRFLEKRKERMETRAKELSEEYNVTSSEDKEDTHQCKRMK